jgi:hypothetical protein
MYEYQVTQYDKQTGEGGLFVQYINTFLELKTEASGFIRIGSDPPRTRIGTFAAFTRMKASS